MYTYRAKIVKVIDGDTVDAVVDLGFNIKNKIRLRLAGINTPELRRPEEVDAATRAKTFVEAKLLDKEFRIMTRKSDKYGRWLAEIFIDGDTTINRLLLQEGLAVDYHE